jgi:hypothetical protein
VWRGFENNNASTLVGTAYWIETIMHEMLLQSEHRTFDMEEADYFYVPAYTSCFLWPVYGWADHPWWWGPNGIRPSVCLSAALLWGALCLWQVGTACSATLPGSLLRKG